ncbi:MAG: iron-containing alcohol dehydrogenase [Bacteroidales bacterium]|nr:iron-containing alcohol dehydrogenase [Clostridia bacterium]MBQ9597852.1 iron-containing alcohol dehydrogenase [Bacteroidales bacterium]
MKMFDVKTQVFFGENALSRLSYTRFDMAFIVADPFVVKSGLLSHVTRRLDEVRTPYVVFDEVVPDPPLDKITRGVQQLLRCKPQLIIAVGGGSAIDSAKAIRKFASYYDGFRNLRLTAIPTTSGTGSEVTSFAVVSDTQKGVKYPLVSDDMIPDEAILDEVMVKTVPAAVTADTGMDVMTHAIEAAVSLNRNEFASAMAEKAVEICNQFLIRSYYDANDAHARRKMHIASCLAGLAFNSAGLGLNHGMAHQLGAQFHIPHGRANAILLPFVIEFNSGVARATRSQTVYDPCVEKYCVLANSMGIATVNPVTTIHALMANIDAMNREMNIPSRVHEMADIRKEDYMGKIERMAQAAIADSCTDTNPRKPSVQDVMELFKKIW